MEIRATSFSYPRNFTKVLLFSRNPGTLRRLTLNANHLISRWKKQKGGIRRIYLCIVPWLPQKLHEHGTYFWPRQELRVRRERGCW